MLPNNRHWIAPLAWALLVLALCGIPGKHLPEITFWKWLRWDKVTHLFLFGVQSYLALRAARKSAVAPLGYLHIWTIVSVSILYGALIEILQLTVFIGRSGDFRDAVANGLGAVIGLGLFRMTFNKDYSR